MPGCLNINSGREHDPFNKKVIAGKLLLRAALNFCCFLGSLHRAERLSSHNFRVFVPFSSSRVLQINIDRIIRANLKCSQAAD